MVRAILSILSLGDTSSISESFGPGYFNVYVSNRNRKVIKN